MLNGKTKIEINLSIKFCPHKNIFLGVFWGGGGRERFDIWVHLKLYPCGIGTGTSKKSMTLTAPVVSNLGCTIKIKLRVKKKYYPCPIPVDSTLIDIRWVEVLLLL